MILIKDLDMRIHVKYSAHMKHSSHDDIHSYEIDFEDSRKL